ncbi:MAG: hypothetical protein EHM33_11205 [Chloroflexi bacterium]|nr:MAG: hypothetical protein EHM33_11205 [Chloroflexota bacterium]
MNADFLRTGFKIVFIRGEIAKPPALRRWRLIFILSKPSLQGQPHPQALFLRALNNRRGNGHIVQCQAKVDRK